MTSAGRLVLIMAASMLFVAGGAASGQQTCRPGWQISPAPRVGGGATLLDVAAVSAHDVWAVGVRSESDVHPGRLLIEHWNGQSWRAVATPSLEDAVLNSVTAVSARDVWAVGARGARTLALHWNGHTWKVVPTPNIVPGSLYGVAAAGPNDVWAVGTRQRFHYISDGPRGALIEHWDGKSWRIVADADSSPKEEFALLDVAARARNDVWAVGGYWHRKGRCIEHWDGKRWKFTLIPVRDCDIQGVATTRAGAAFAAGGSLLGWARGRWTKMRGRLRGGFSSVAARSGGDAWAVGIDFRDPHDQYNNRVRAHWNGRAWQMVAPPWTGDPDSLSSELNAVAVVSATDAWAVGARGWYDDTPHALIEHYACANR